MIIASVVPASIGIILFIAVLYFLRIRNSKKRITKVQTTGEEPADSTGKEPDWLWSKFLYSFGLLQYLQCIIFVIISIFPLDLTGISIEESLQYDFATIQHITNVFAHKIGEGGYGSVYKVKSLTWSTTNIDIYAHFSPS